MRRHELPSPLLFGPHMRRLKLTAVRFIVFFAAPGREHRHDGSVTVEVLPLPRRYYSRTQIGWVELQVFDRRVAVPC